MVCCIGGVSWLPNVYDDDDDDDNDGHFPPLYY